MRNSFRLSLKLWLSLWGHNDSIQYETFLRELDFMAFGWYLYTLLGPRCINLRCFARKYQWKGHYTKNGWSYPIWLFLKEEEGLLNNSCFTRNKQISLVVLKETMKFAGVKLWR